MIISAGFSANKKGAHVERPAGFAYWSMGFFAKGSIELKSGGRVTRGGPGALVMVPPGVAYNLLFLSRKEEIWCIFEPRPEIRAFLQRGGAESGAGVFELRGPRQLPQVRAAMNELLARWEQSPPHVLLAENALERVLLLVNEQRAPVPMDERIRKAVDFMQGHYAEPLSVSDIAKVASLSGSRFAHLFRKQAGMSPAQYLDHRRMERAQQLLLSTRMPVQEIAMQVGYPNQFHFSTRFRKLAGQAPRDYRRRPQRRWQSLPTL